MELFGTNGEGFMEKTVADLKAFKARQQAAWSSGDCALIGTTLQIVGERQSAQT